MPDIEQTHLKHLLKDEKRTDMLTCESDGIYADFSRQRVTAETLKVQHTQSLCPHMCVAHMHFLSWLAPALVHCSATFCGADADAHKTAIMHATQDS